MNLANLAAALVLPLSLAACSAEVSVGGGYDSDDVAAEVQRAQEKVTPDLEVTDPTCADDEPEEGATIDCAVTIDGVEAPYSVTFTSVGDDGVDFDLEPTLAIVSTEKTVDAIAAELEKSGYAGVEVDCGEPAVVVDEPGAIFRCDVTQEGGGTTKATVTIEDLDGNISFQA